MSAKKKAKKRLPKPVPCECWVVVSKKHPDIYAWSVYCSESSAEARCRDSERVIRVRITPVAKRRKEAPR